MDIKREDLLQLYYYLKLTRRFEDRISSLYHQGKILGGAWTSNGTEAVSVGYGYALERNDIAAPYFRDMGVFLIRWDYRKTDYGTIFRQENRSYWW